MGSENSALVDEIFDAFYDTERAHHGSLNRTESSSALAKMFTDYLPSLMIGNQRAAIQAVARRLGMTPDALLYNNMHIILAHMLLHPNDFVPCIQTLSMFFPNFNFAECVCIAIDPLLRCLVSSRSFFSFELLLFCSGCFDSFSLVIFSFSSSRSFSKWQMMQALALQLK
jgi:hypothetical protein